MPTQSSKLYEKYCNGDKLTNSDITLGLELFKKAADSLIVLGPAFSIAFKEANNMYIRFDGIARARGLNE